jgi:hypothetical protein
MQEPKRYNRKLRNMITIGIITLGLFASSIVFAHTGSAY